MEVGGEPKVGGDVTDERRWSEGLGCGWGWKGLRAQLGRLDRDVGRKYHFDAAVIYYL